MNRTILFRRQYWNSSHIILLFVLAVLCFWPLSFGIFSAKNDNITQFLPVRFHVSEALRNGNLPLWNPYMYLGYPIHGDMQGGTWNPVVWLLSLSGRYNVYSIHAEIIIYIFLAGCGMYRLLGEKISHASIRFSGAAAYMMCGYIADVSGSNLPFLAAAAYIPFVFAYYHQLFIFPSPSNSIKAALATTLLFVSAYPSFFILTAYVLLAALIVVIYKNYRNKNPIIKKLISYNAISILFFVCLSAPAILSYWQILPFYQRGNGVNLVQAMVNSFHPSCSLSFIIPTAGFRNPASSSTDLISRNAYFNSILLVFACCYFRARKTIFFNFVLTGILFFFLFSLGDHTPVRGWCYKLLPLMDTFRHPSNGRLFLIIAAIIIATYVYQSYLKESLPKKTFTLIAGILMAGIAILITTSWNDFSLSKKLSAIQNSGKELRYALKEFFDTISFNELVVVNGIVQLVFLGLFIYVFTRQKIKIKWLTLLIIGNSFLFAQFSLPYTVVSKTSPSGINQLLKKFPEGYPKPGTLSIEENSKQVLANFDTLGISGLYDKKMSLTNAVYTPTFMLPLDQAFKDSNSRKLMFLNSYAYFANEIAQPSTVEPGAGIAYSMDQKLLNIKEPGSGEFVLEHIASNRFQFYTKNKADAIFILQQVHLPGWSCAIDGQKTDIISVNTAFMAILLAEGNHRIIFEYQPAGIGASFILSFLVFIIAILLLLKTSVRETST